MFNGYTESEEKIEARKRRILGTVTPTHALPAQGNDKQNQKTITRKVMLKREILIAAILYPIGLVLSDLLGRYVAALMR
jgi:hypothetical protein